MEQFRLLYHFYSCSRARQWSLVRHQQYYRRLLHDQCAKCLVSGRILHRRHLLECSCRFPLRNSGIFDSSLHNFSYETNSLRDDVSFRRRSFFILLWQRRNSYFVKLKYIHRHLCLKNNLKCLLFHWEPI